MHRAVNLIGFSNPLFAQFPIVSVLTPNWEATWEGLRKAHFLIFTIETFMKERLQRRRKATLPIAVMFLKNVALYVLGLVLILLACRQFFVALIRRE